MRAETSLARSLRLLRRDQLDLLLLHRGEQRAAYQGQLWEALCRKRASGAIRQLGISATHPGEACALLEDPTVDALQVATSLLDQRLVRRGFFQRAAELGKPIFVRSIYLQGVAHLASADLPAHLAELTASIPDLPDSLLDPSQWGSS